MRYVGPEPQFTLIPDFLVPAAIASLSLGLVGGGAEGCLNIPTLTLQV